jgi:hypothetical protein
VKVHSLSVLKPEQRRSGFFLARALCTVMFWASFVLATRVGNGVIRKHHGPDGKQ